MMKISYHAYLINVTYALFIIKEMSSHKVVVITTKGQFDLVYNDFKESARIKTNPDIFLVGLDAEYICKDNNQESFARSGTWVKKADKIAVCKLQIASGTMSLVIDLCKFGGVLPDGLVGIITGESWIKAGVGIGNDLNYLSYNFELGMCNGAIDIKIIAQLCGCMRPNLLDLYRAIRGTYCDTIDDFELVKKSGAKEDWSNELTIGMIEYASLDSIMSYECGKYIVDNMMNGLTKFRSQAFDMNKDKKESGGLGSGSTSASAMSAMSAISKPQLITTTIMNKNYVGALQEYAQKRAITLPDYKEVVCDDPTKQFKMACLFQGVAKYGYGLNKKDAKNQCARDMFKSIMGSEA